MSSVDETFERWAAAEKAGKQPNAESYADGLTRPERREFMLRVGMFRARPPEPAAPAADDPRVERLARAASGLSGAWPSMLPRLRERRNLDRSELTRQLADELGRGDDIDRVDEYYHQLEWGNLSAGNVNRSVIEALSKILGEDPDELWQAGTAGMDRWSKRVRKSKSGRLPKRAFARLAGETKPLTVDDSMFDPPSRSDWDETDRLFLGG